MYGEYFADPFVWRRGREYFAIGTGAVEAAGTTAATDGPSVFPLLRSRDLVHWEPRGRALIAPDAALGNSFWAPEIVESAGEWYLFYSVGHGDTKHQLRVAHSLEPLGPFHDIAALTSLDQVPFAIDPHPFRDADGQWYLFHARDFLDGGEGSGAGKVLDVAGGGDVRIALDTGARQLRAGTALVVSALVDMTSLAPEAITVARATCDWQRFAQHRQMYGRIFDWHTLEGPFVVHEGGRYYCLYSGGCWESDTYGVDYVVADTPLGPWSDAGVESGPRVLRSVPQRMLGPGHCSAVIGPDDSTMYLAYHAWDAAMSARRLCIDELWFMEAGPRSSGPSWMPRPAPRVRDPAQG